VADSLPKVLIHEAKRHDWSSVQFKASPWQYKTEALTHQAVLQMVLGAMCFGVDFGHGRPLGKRRMESGARFPPRPSQRYQSGCSYSDSHVPTQWGYGDYVQIQVSGQRLRQHA
jgi:hypothetical protein